MFSATRQRGDLHELLEHHADAEPPRVLRASGSRPARPSSADLAGVRAVEAVEDLHERALARAVLADDGVHLARVDVEVDAIVGDARRGTPW